MIDATELAAEAYLRREGFASVQHEPDGNIPPDFLIEGRIAVEVRRLDKAIGSLEGFRSLEQDAIPLIQGFSRLLGSFGKSDNDCSWYVSCRFRRPFPRWGSLRVSVNRLLARLLKGEVQDHIECELDRNFSVRFLRAAPDRIWTFHLGSVSDFDSGGWVVADLFDNLSRCISEKSNKILRVRQKYGEWWLVLVDYLHGSISADFSKASFWAAFDGVNCFNRILIIGRGDQPWQYELRSIHD